MAILPEKSLTMKINAVETEQQLRPYLGGSIIGHPCARYLAYAYRWAFKDVVESKLQRIFDLGHATEDILVKALESAGVEVSGSQTTVCDETGHIRGAIDGLLTDVPGKQNQKLLFEGKSANRSNYNSVVKNGVKDAMPKHYSQMQFYMGCLELQEALYMVMNKDSSDIYIEFVEFDEAHFELSYSRALAIVESDHINEFNKVGSNPSWFQCKGCPARDKCHEAEPVEKNCRTCEYSSPAMEGKWKCNFHNTTLTLDGQRNGCDSWQLGGYWHL